MAIRSTPPEPIPSIPQSAAVRAWETMRRRALMDPATATLDRKLTISMGRAIRDAGTRQAIRAAKNKPSVPVTVTIDQIMAKLRANDYRCALTGLPFWDDDADRFGPTIPTIDRIDVDGPYSDENTRVVLLGVNSLRGRGSDADMLRIARALVDRWGA